MQELDIELFYTLKNNWGELMKKEKIVSIIILVLIILILIGQAVYINRNKNMPLEDVPLVIQDEDDNKYVKEQTKEKFSLRILEADNKEYVTLFIETNIFENEEIIQISYNNEKYILNTANPILENAEIEKGNEINKFSISVSSLENYSIIFIKKDSKNIVDKNDIVVE